MPRFSSVFAALSLLVVTAGEARPSASGQQTVTPRQVIEAPDQHIGKSVAWVVRFRQVLIDVAPDGTVTGERTLYEWREDNGTWSGRLVIGPAIRGTRWTAEASQSTADLFRSAPHMLSGVVRSVEQRAGAGGSVSAIPVLSDATMDLPASLAQPPSPAVVFGEGAYSPGRGVTPPAPLREVKPVYPATVGTGVQGEVHLEIIVNADGTVTDVRIVKSLDAKSGLDAAAVAAARHWLFTPGTLDGRPVPTRVGLILSFTRGK
jgi:protein TonB